MKRFALPILFLLSTILFSSCLDIVEEIFLKKNGKGTYKLSIDMSKMMQNEMMKSMIEGSLGLEGDDSKPSEPKKERDMMVMDTIMYFKDAPADMKEAFADRKHLGESLNIRMKVDEKAKELFMVFNMKFEKVDDINFFMQNLSKMSEQGSGALGGAGGGIDGLIPGAGKDVSIYNASKRSFERKETPSGSEEVNEEEMQMAKMFFADASYSTIYHFPKKVKKMSNKKNAELSNGGKTVTTTVDLLDLMGESGSTLANKIKF